MMKLAIAFLTLVALSIVSFTQNTGSQAQPVKPADPAKPFISTDGKFSIALPEVSGDPVSWDVGIGKFTGQGYTWHMSECSYTLYYADKPGDMRSRNAGRVLETFRRQVLYQMQVEKGKNRLDMPIRMGYYPGREFKWETEFMAVMMHAYCTGDRLYVLTANVPEPQGKDKSAAMKTLGSFKILEDSDLKRLNKK